ncbi:MAG TPA: polysaccharide deacetylase family protein [Cytophagaceae bacterium]|jgi:peptidoglycan/xylan/chitin deacetylase (PgdA/CDA1 family)|nr:polysaccharide deacetylase family protein [Cytophagaceae bacterium]
MKLITTSWDDGYKGDFRLAELLEKYNLKGTFYIPASNEEHEVMSEKEVIELSSRFEIGGHTMTHTRINNVSAKLFADEIQGCYNWLTNLVGEPPVSFCFPRGVYNKPAVEYTLRCGFKIIRTTELLNPWFDKNNSIIPTTLQVYNHSELTYCKHLFKRFKIKSLMLYLKSNRSSDLQRSLEYYLTYIQEHGGCFHLWGHSWEIEEFNLWIELENLFKIMSNISGIEYVNNKELLRYKNN